MKHVVGRQARKNLTSETGKDLRKKRSVEVETLFGHIKYPIYRSEGKLNVSVTIFARPRHRFSATLASLNRLTDLVNGRRRG